MRRLIFPLALGLAGCAVLVALGLWQLRRLDWKEAELARIEAAIAAVPVALPEGEGDEYLAVEATGRLVPPLVRIVHSGSEELIVAAFETDGRRVMVDLGLSPYGAPPDLPEGEVRIDGNLERPAGTEVPEVDAVNARTGRTLTGLAQALDAEPVLLVARNIDPALPGTAPLPVTTEGIPNNHLGYAIQWFGLALVWAGMSVYLALRSARKDS
ncbi:SURF1 family protein [Wenxinia marina]|uniref:SURF1-like protein n=1 Tax=Wenxinia marina DSM 24838 TaxID=1123501 RepID=A0A0D0QAC7_9RHOB|nr:SURF1 family protein [Wenxinia marina]KIQ67953.1 hypothetical protein Wenmar_03408 [Wenxinia marina DSM 24838]GGL75935.1 SURF1-like protein [Wenxinia marina]